MRVRVGDGHAVHIQFARRGIYQGLRFDQTFFHGQTNDERLHGRTRLKGIGQRAVAQLRAAQVAALVGRVTGVIGQRQNVTGLRIQHHHAAGRRFVLEHGFAQALVSKVLHLAVYAELQVFAFDRRHHVAHTFDHLALTVFDDATGAVLAAQVGVEGQFHAFLAEIFHIGETDHVGSGLTLRVHAFVFHGGVNAMDSKFLDFFTGGVVELTAQPHVFAARVADLGLQLGQRHVQQLPQRLELRSISFHLFGTGPDAGHGHAGREYQAVAVQDAAAVGGNVQLSFKTHNALLAKKRIAHHLHISGTHHQPDETQRNASDDELAAPDRRLAGQQWVGGILNAAAAHG